MNLHKDRESMELLISNITKRSKIREDVLEKDYYVTLLLEELATKENQANAFFKGGTALYKALKSVRRFSEDIDLTVNVEGLPSKSQEQKRLKNVANGFSVLDVKEKLTDKKGIVEVAYKYNPLFTPATSDILQRCGNVKVEATSFTVSKPIKFIEIAPHIYELADVREKQILEDAFEVKPFKIGTISLERIFVDKIFAAEFYYIRKKWLDFSKHIYDITTVYKLGTVYALLGNASELGDLIELKRLEEKNRIGGVPDNVKIKDFEYFKNIKFYNSSTFKDALRKIHNIYVFDERERISIEDVKSTLEILKQIFIHLGS
ncbi:MAG TPA: nucleotidyl transferase AbiEii/AbiGii toxin family protein [Clostridia bacterium]|jgi:hypothetical protein|nr:nucleotidyl transferase AbiEii/AbiGii toxin family protein [Clostridia bacterium]